MTTLIGVVVMLLLVVAAYFLGENRGKAAVALERAKLDAYREQLSGYLDHFGDRVKEEYKEHFSEFLRMLGKKLGDLF